MQKKKITHLAATGLIVLSTALMTSVALAENNPQEAQRAKGHAREEIGKFGGKMMGRPFSGQNGVVGTVTAVAGNTITITAKNGTTYTIDATNAQFPKNMFGTQLTIANIAVGDMVSARGTVNGTQVTASMIADPTFLTRTMFEGKVTAVNGSTITITGRNNSTYTVDASSAKMQSGFGDSQKTITVSDIKVGDRIIAMGTVNGTTITASNIEEMQKPSFAHKMLGMFKHDKE